MITLSRPWIAIAILISAEVAEVRAQDAEPVAATKADSATSQMSESERFARRLGAAFLGQIPVLVVGGFVGSSLSDELKIRCECMYPGSDEGALVGAIIGASMFAALPDLGSSCSGERRWRRALAGSLVGVSPALVAWAATGRREFLLVTGMLGPIGAAGGTHPC